MDIQTIIELLIFVLPAYVANAVPVLLGGGTPLDFGKNFSDQRRIFGEGKTIMGFLAGIFAGIVTGGIITFIATISIFTNTKMQFLGFTAMAFGTMIGDAFGSFLKRRLGMDIGKPFILDQLMFFIIALLFAVPFVSSSIYTIESLLFLFVMTYIFHIGSNIIANRLGWKKVPW